MIRQGRAGRDKGWEIERERKKERERERERLDGEECLSDTLIATEWLPLGTGARHKARCPLRSNMLRSTVENLRGKTLGSAGCWLRSFCAHSQSCQPLRLLRFSVSRLLLFTLASRHYYALIGITPSLFYFVIDKKNWAKLDAHNHCMV